MCGNVGALSLAHPLRLGLGQILRRTQPHGNKRKENTGNQGSTNEATTQQDDGRVVTRGGHDDAEAQQRNTAHDRADKAHRAPIAHLAALAPHQSDARDDRHDGTHVAPLKGARRVQDRAKHRGNQQSHARDDHTVTRDLGGPLLTHTHEAGAERARRRGLGRILGDRHPQPQVGDRADAEKGQGDEAAADHHDRDAQVHGQARAHARHPGGRHVRTGGCRARKRGPGGRCRNRRRPPRMRVVDRAAHVSIVARPGTRPGVPPAQSGAVQGVPYYREGTPVWLSSGIRSECMRIPSRGSAP